MPDNKGASGCGYLSVWNVWLFVSPKPIDVVTDKSISFTRADMFHKDRSLDQRTALSAPGCSVQDKLQVAQLSWPPPHPFWEGKRGGLNKGPLIVSARDIVTRIAHGISGQASIQIKELQLFQLFKMKTKFDWGRTFLGIDFWTSMISLTSWLCFLISWMKCSCSHIWMGSKWELHEEPHRDDLSNWMCLDGTHMSQERDDSKLKPTCVPVSLCHFTSFHETLVETAWFWVGVEMGYSWIAVPALLAAPPSPPIVATRGNSFFTFSIV